MIQKEAFDFFCFKRWFNDFQGNPFEQVQVLSFRTDNCCPVEPGGFFEAALHEVEEKSPAFSEVDAEERNI